MSAPDVPPSRLTLAKLGFIATSGFSMMLILPVILGGMADQLGFSDAVIGRVAAFNSLGIAVGALYVPLSGGRFRLVKAVRISLIGLLVADVAGLWLSAPFPFYLFRFLGGCFGGVMYASILRSMAGIPNPGIGYSFYVIVYCSWAAFLFVVAPFILEFSGLQGLFCLIIFSDLVTLLFISELKGFDVKALNVGADALRSLLRKKTVLASLFSYLLLMIGCGASWPYIERMGDANGFSAEYIGLVLSVSNLSGILAGFLVLRFGTGSGVTRPIVLGMVVLALGFWAAGMVPLNFVYFLGVFFLEGAWSFLIACFQKVQAMVDTEGKIVSLGATINLSGRAIGPALAGLFLTGNSYAPAIWFSLLLFGLCFLVILPTLLVIDKKSAGLSFK